MLPTTSTSTFLLLVWRKKFSSMPMFTASVVWPVSARPGWVTNMPRKPPLLVPTGAVGALVVTAMKKYWSLSATGGEESAKPPPVKVSL